MWLWMRAYSRSLWKWFWIIDFYARVGNSWLRNVRRHFVLNRTLVDRRCSCVLPLSRGYFEVSQKDCRTLKVWKYLTSSNVRFVTEKKSGIHFLQQYFYASLQISCIYLHLKLEPLCFALVRYINKMIYVCDKYWEERMLRWLPQNCLNLCRC